MSLVLKAEGSHQESPAHHEKRMDTARSSDSDEAPAAKKAKVARDAAAEAKTKDNEIVELRQQVQMPQGNSKSMLHQGEGKGEVAEGTGKGGLIPWAPFGGQRLCFAEGNPWAEAS